MFILIEDYFITTQVFNLVFYRGRGGGGEVNTVVIVKNAKRKTTKKKTNLANIQLSGPYAWLKETFKFEDENSEEYDIRLKVFRSSQKKKLTPGKLHCTFDSPNK